MLKNSVRGSDAVVRYGGDEFLVILADSTEKGAVAVIERVPTPNVRNVICMRRASAPIFQMFCS